MRRIVFEDISIFVVKHIFHLRFFVSRLTQKSKIMDKLINKLLFEKDVTYYIPSEKSVTTVEEIEINHVVQRPDDVVIPTDVLKSVIKEADEIVIMNRCLCRNSTGCEDYPIDLGCIFLGNATKNISRKHCREATTEEALAHIDKCSDAGLIHIMGKNRIDSIWMNARPEEELFTICNCCPCCCLWRVLPDLSDNIKTHFYKLPGVSLKENDELCVGCSKCVEVCYGKAITLENNKAKINDELCVGCGQCSLNCPTNAITLDYTKKSVDSVLNKLTTAVNIKK